MSQGTDVSYNGIILNNVVTKQWNQQITYDESGTDPLAVQYTLAFEGILHLQSVANAPLSQSIETPWVAQEGQPTAGFEFGALLSDVQRRLSVPRKTLSVRMGGTTVLTVFPADQSPRDYDVDNGPKPQFVRVTNIVSDKVVRVQFSIVAAIHGCPSGITPNSIILNNRWSVSEEMDENFFTTKTIRGTVRFARSGPNNQQPGAQGSFALAGHAYKHIVIPALENGFRRVRMQYVVSESGLSAQYSITDRQTHTSAPWPATKITGQHSESTGDGVQMIRSCRVRLEGSPAANKRLLVERAIQVIQNRIPALAKPLADDNVWFPEEMTLTDFFGEANAVEVNVRIRMPADKQKGDDDKPIELGNLIATRFATPIENIGSVDDEPEEYNNTRSRLPSVYGENPGASFRSPADLFLNHCYLQTQCSPLHSIGSVSASPAVGDEGESQDRGRTEIERGQQRYEIQESSGSLWTDEEKVRAAPYTYSRMESTYFYNSLRTQMPIARTPTDSESETRDTSVVFRLGRRQCRRELRADSERLNDWPEIPQPKDEYTDGELKGSRLRFFHRNHPPTLTADGRSKLYRITSYYLYAMNRPPLDSEELMIGSLPFTSLKAEDEKFKPEDAFSDKLGIV